MDILQLNFPVRMFLQKSYTTQLSDQKSPFVMDKSAINCHFQELYVESPEGTRVLSLLQHSPLIGLGRRAGARKFLRPHGTLHVGRGG